MEATKYWLEQIKNFLDSPILKLGETHLTLWSFLYFIALLLLLFYAAGKIK